MLTSRMFSLDADWRSSTALFKPCMTTYPVHFRFIPTAGPTKGSSQYRCSFDEHRLSLQQGASLTGILSGLLTPRQHAQNLQLVDRKACGNSECNASSPKPQLSQVAISNRQPATCGNPAISSHPVAARICTHLVMSTKNPLDEFLVIDCAVSVLVGSFKHGVDLAGIKRRIQHLENLC